MPTKYYVAPTFYSPHDITIIPVNIISAKGQIVDVTSVTTAIDFKTRQEYLHNTQEEAIQALKERTEQFVKKCRIRLEEVLSNYTA